MKMRKKTLLSDKIADALTVKPRADIEEDHVFGTKPKTVTREDFQSSGSDNEADISDFRKKNLSLLSEISKKYEGKVVSRKELDTLETNEESSFDENVEKIFKADVSKIESQNTGSEESDASENDLDHSIIKFDKSNSMSMERDTCEDGDDEDNDDGEIDSDDGERDSDDGERYSDDGDGDSDDDDDEGYDISQLETPVLENFEHMKKQNVSEEVKKGESVRNQLLLWENLLEMRIHMQRCINTANQLPMSDVFQSMKNVDHDKFIEESNLAKSNISNVLDKLLNMQKLLFNNFPDTKNMLSDKKSKTSNDKNNEKNNSDEEIPSDTDNEEIPSDTEEEEDSTKYDTTNNKNKQKTIKTTNRKRKLEEYESEISESHKTFKTFRDATIKKWNEKTRIGSAANIKNLPTNTILQQISFILSDRNKLIRRTQLKRSEYDIIGYEKPSNTSENKDSDLSKDRKDNDEYIPEIFDDSDFYHQLLRELIECKSSDISDPVQLSRQWIALQQMRSKMKRKVDTKATKGRRIKYVVHNPLVNFMAPEKNLSWTDESKNELYSSLFGKMFENNNAMDVDNNFLFSNK